MDRRWIALILGSLTVVFAVLNFTLENAGTIFLIPAVIAGFGANYILARPGRR